MNLRFILLIVLGSIWCSYGNGSSRNTNQRFVFFLHNRFLEDHTLDELHPEYGRAAYLEIIKEYEDAGFTVISEKRKGNVDVKKYALKVKGQIDSLLNIGIEPGKITVIGTSKGGYIAQFVSTYAKIPDLNFVFIACYSNSDIQIFRIFLK